MRIKIDVEAVRTWYYTHSNQSANHFSLRQRLETERIVPWNNGEKDGHNQKGLGTCLGRKVRYAIGPIAIVHNTCLNEFWACNRKIKNLLRWTNCWLDLCVTFKATGDAITSGRYRGVRSIKGLHSEARRPVCMSHHKPHA